MLHAPCEPPLCGLTSNPVRRRDGRPGAGARVFIARSDRFPGVGSVFFVNWTPWRHGPEGADPRTVLGKNVLKPNEVGGCDGRLCDRRTRDKRGQEETAREATGHTAQSVTLNEVSCGLLAAGRLPSNTPARSGGGRAARTISSLVLTPHPGPSPELRVR